MAMVIDYAHCAAKLLHCQNLEGSYPISAPKPV
uniref:Uncharacterized protein n=1 Tax=Rhizophora mucronata TaxID=61149 RepID=A0A2P2QGH7_RHIMU